MRPEEIPPGVLHFSGAIRMQGLNMADVRAFQQKLKEVENRKVPMAARWALNDMAFAVLNANRKLMQSVFDRPTPFTLNAFYVKKATLSDMTAVVERKRAQSGRHFLEVQSDGGPRKMTGVERLMTQRLRYSGLIAAVVPTKHLKRNQYGNVPPGILNRIISGVQAQGDASANTTADSRARANGRSRRRAEYFVPKADSKLSPGVYERSGADQSIKKVLAFSEAAPSYSQRFPMEEHAQKVAADTMDEAFERGFRRAMQAG